MANNKFMGTFETESEVLRKIEELKNQGVSEDHMYVMAHDKEQLSMVRGRTDVDYKSAEGGWMDKFMGFLSGNEPVREAFSGMGVDEQEADSYYRDVQNGKILLFVDQEIGSNYDANDHDIDRNVYGDPGNNTTGAAGYVGATGSDASYGDSGMVARDGLTVDTNESNDVNYHRERGERGLTDDDDLAASERQNTDETAGVGEDRGTGFGLGPGVSMESENRKDHQTDRTDTTNGLGRDTMSKDNELNTDRDRTATNLSGNGTDAAKTEEERLRLHEERLNVNKDRVQTGEVNVGKHTVENEQTIEVPVEREEVYVERRPVNEETNGASTDAYKEGENIHIPLTEERVNVSKSDVVSEEIVVGKKKVQDTETIRETVRKEEAEIEEGASFTDKNKKDTTLSDLDDDDFDGNRKEHF
jgi:uncharacterized protein (TIGR02271 family)